MPYRIKGTLKQPSGQPAAGVDIEFISRRNYSPLLMDLSSIIKTTSTGAYDITLEYGEYAVVVYWGCNQPSHIGKLFVFSDTAIGLDLQTLLQQADWQPATPEYIQQIQDWLAQAGASASQAVNSAAAAKASEIAAEADRAEVASNKTIVVDAQTDVSAKAADVTAKAAQVATNTATVSEKTPLAVAAADTASQKAASAAESDASARDAATRAENAALAMTGAILDGGQCDLSSGFYPQPLTVNGQKYSTVWYVKVGGSIGGVTYDAGDKLQYTTANNGFYFRIDARDDVVSVNGEKGAVTLNAQKVGADPAGTASSLIEHHATKAGAHQINGVSGLTEELADLRRFIPKHYAWTPTWWINARTLRFMDMRILWAAVGGSGDPSNEDLNPYRFDVVLSISCPAANVWHHHYAFSIHRPVANNDGVNWYAYPSSFTCYTAYNKGDIYFQTVPKEENNGYGYWELKAPVDLQGVQGLVVYGNIYAYRLY